MAVGRSNLRGMRATLTLSGGNAAGRIANVFGKVDTVTRQAVQEVVADAGAREYQRAYDLAPKLTFFLADHLRYRLTKDRLAYEIGWKSSDFTSEGFAPYFQYTEFGTSKMAARPCLFPAREEIRPYFRANLSRALRQAIARRGRGA
jgi:HK97 gp10 family phage protein